MPPTLSPMIHVPDVRTTALWYLDIGFTLAGWHEEDADQLGSGPLAGADAPLDWACVTLGDARIMFNAGGRPSGAERREFDLYIDLGTGPGASDVDSLHDQLRDRVDVVAQPYDAFHGARELIIRDLNRFWITFAQPVVAA